MIDPSDWRLQGQERYLKGGAKFMVEGLPETLHEGFSTEDQYHWICGTCFEDFRSVFGWTVKDSSPER